MKRIVFLDDFQAGKSSSESGLHELSQLLSEAVVEQHGEGNYVTISPLKPLTQSNKKRKLKPKCLHYSQETASDVTSEGDQLHTLAQKMGEAYWQEENGMLYEPIDLVSVRQNDEDILVTVDHRRVIAALINGNTRVLARIHGEAEELPVRFKHRRFVGANTWGDAVRMRLDGRKPCERVPEVPSMPKTLRNKSFSHLPKGLLPFSIFDEISAASTVIDEKMERIVVTSKAVTPKKGKGKKRTSQTFSLTSMNIR